MSRLARAACLAAAASALACATLSGLGASPALCVLDRPGGAPRPDADVWIALLLRGFDPHTRRVASPPIDCGGHQVRWDLPAFRCDDEKAARVPLPARPLGPADVIVTPVSDDTDLVWIATTRFATGDAAGPVALVTTVGTQLRVTAIGTLRTFPDRARLRLETLGGSPVLVGDGERCGASGAGCVRGARVVPLRGDRFEPMSILGSDGRCLAPAWFDVVRRERRRASGGWEQLELTATLSFSGAERGALSVEEQVTVLDVAAGEARAGARVLQRAESSREVRWDGAHLLGTGTPLWSRITAGRTDLQ